LCEVKYSKDEKAFLELKTKIEPYQEAITQREKLDAILVDPNSFKGVIDREATKQQSRHAPIYKKVILLEQFAELFEELKNLRKELGRKDIKKAKALKQARILEEQAGLKGVIGSTKKEQEARKTLLKQIEAELDNFGFRPNYDGCYDGGDNNAARAEFDREIDRFFIPIRNGILLKPIPPVEIDFEAAVNSVLHAVPTAVLGKAPDPYRKKERPTMVNARYKLAQLVSKSPEFRQAIEDFFHAAEVAMREEGHIVFQQEKPENKAKVQQKLEA
jgi:hypothetical protein